MLLEFRVGNFRSIREQQVLSLVAAEGDDSLAETNLSSTGLKSLPHVLRSVVIYGPNASGKSTLLHALNYMRAVVAESATVIQPGQTYNVQPFRLDTASISAPTTFELTFLLDGVRHQYAFAMTPQRIVSESLVVYRTKQPTRMFERYLSADGQTETYEFSAYLTGARKLWQESTRSNALFLSTAAQLNSDLLSPVFHWLVACIGFVASDQTVPHDYTTALLSTDEGRARVCDFLSAADFSIDDVQTVQRKHVSHKLVLNSGGLTQGSREESEVLVPLFKHNTANGSATFELHEESQGTQHFYGLIAPVLDALSTGHALVVDELDSSLHTLLVRRLLALFHDSTANPRGAQVIFSTHDTSLLDHTLFRRDQIWFTEKDSSQATTLYPLSDFNTRKQGAWERGYLTGRYGAIPYFGKPPSLTSEIADVAVRFDSAVETD